MNCFLPPGCRVYSTNCTLRLLADGQNHPFKDGMVLGVARLRRDYLRALEIAGLTDGTPYGILADRLEEMGNALAERFRVA